MNLPSEALQRGWHEEEWKQNTAVSCGSARRGNPSGTDRGWTGAGRYAWDAIWNSLTVEKCQHHYICGKTIGYDKEKGENVGDVVVGTVSVFTVVVVAECYGPSTNMLSISHDSKSFRERWSLRSLVLNLLVNLKLIVPCIIWALQPTEWFQKLVESLSYAYGLWELPQVVVDDCLIIAKQTILNIIQTICIFCCGVNLQDKDRTWERTWTTGSLTSAKECVLDQQLPGSSAPSKTALGLLLLSGHFCKTSQ